MGEKRSSRKRRLPKGLVCLEGDPHGGGSEEAATFGSRHVHERKDLQLCQQIAEALRLALAECRDPHLDDVDVDRVEPTESLARVRVVVTVDDVEGIEQATVALQRARRYLRAQVASSIHRKRTPELVFAVVPLGGER